MTGALVIAFREVIEAGLIVGIILAATRGIPGRGRWIALGTGAGLAGAIAVALFAGRISNTFDGSGQELLNATVLLVAVAMLGWHNAWMSRHGREMARNLAATGAAVRGGERPIAALAIAVGGAILREGSELALFLYGLVASGTSGPELMLGAALGIALGIAVSSLGFFGLLAIPTRHLFSVTSALIVLLAAGMAAQAIQFLSDAGVVPVLDRPVWNTSASLPEDGLLGKVLHALVGYTDRPTGAQLIAYGAVVLLMIGLMRWARPASDTRPSTRGSAAARPHSPSGG